MKLRTRILAYIIIVMAMVFVMVLATILPDALRESKTSAAAAREAASTLAALFARLPEPARRELGLAPPLYDGQGVLSGWLLADAEDRVCAWGLSETPVESVTPEFIASRHFDIVEHLRTPDGKRVVLYARTRLRTSVLQLDVWGVFLVMVVGTALLVFVVFGVLLRIVIKPVERMAAASRSALATHGVLQPVMHTDRQDEIGELVRAYNRMVAEVNDLRLNLETRVNEATNDLKAAQSQLVLSERLSEAGRVAAGVAHEINNPLGGMINAARSLHARAAQGSRDAQYLELLLEGMDRIRTIVSKLLQFARPSPQPGPVDLKEVMEDALLFCGHRVTKLNITVVKEFARDCVVVARRSEMGQVFLNLMVNALDAMESKGYGPHTLVLRTARDGEHVRASVQDSGTGMSAEVRQRAGQFFFSTKGEGKGTGLGLAVVQHIVKQQNGQMQIDSVLNEGTTITVVLPVEKMTKT